MKEKMEFKRHPKKEGEGKLSGVLTMWFLKVANLLGVEDEKFSQIGLKHPISFYKDESRVFLWNEVILLFQCFRENYTGDHAYNDFSKTVYSNHFNIPYAKIVSKIPTLKLALWCTFSEARSTKSSYYNAATQLRWIDKRTYQVCLETLYEEDIINDDVVEFILAGQRYYSTFVGYPPSEVISHEVDLSEKRIIITVRIADHRKFITPLKRWVKSLLTYGKQLDVYKQANEQKLASNEREEQTRQSLESLFYSMTHPAIIISNEKIIEKNTLYQKYFLVDQDSEILQKIVTKLEQGFSEFTFTLERSSKGKLHLKAIALSQNKRSPSGESLIQLQDLALPESPEELISLTKVQERKHLAHDMHDSLGQLFTASSFHIASLQSEETNPEKKDKLDTLQELMREIMIYSRSFTRQLDQLIEHSDTLSEAFQIVLLEFNIISKIQTQNRLSNYPDYLDTAEAKRALCYVLQEAFNNAYRHGKATQFTIQSQTSESEYQILFTNNGTPFEPQKTAHGLGLRTMENRVQSLGGTFRLSLNAESLICHTLTFPIHDT